MRWVLIKLSIDTITPETDNAFMTKKEFSATEVMVLIEELHAQFRAFGEGLMGLNDKVSKLTEQVQGITEMVAKNTVDITIMKEDITIMKKDIVIMKEDITS